MPGTVIVGKSCLMDRRLFCCLGGGVVFFQQRSWKCAGAHFGARKFESLEAEGSPCL